MSEDQEYKKNGAIMNRKTGTVAEIIETLKGEGYIYEFCIKDGVLQCSSTDRKYIPKDLTVDKVETFEGDSAILGKTIIYAFSANDGTNGIMIDSYNIYSEPKLAKMIREIPWLNRKELQLTKI